MLKILLEPLDPERHVDFMSSYWVGGLPPEQPKHNLDQRFVVIIRTTRAELQFHSPKQVRDAIQHFALKVRPSGRRGTHVMEHYRQAWHERLPRGIMAEKQRIPFLAALKEAERLYCGTDPERFVCIPGTARRPAHSGRDT